jgi:hypothetical protein
LLPVASVIVVPALSTSLHCQHTQALPADCCAACWPLPHHQPTAGGCSPQAATLVALQGRPAQHAGETAAVKIAARKHSGISSRHMSICCRGTKSCGCSLAASLDNHSALSIC